MIRTKILALLLFFSTFLSGQNKSDAVKKLEEIQLYSKLIDSTAKELNEGIAEGPIEYKGIFKKNGGWTAYFLYKNLKDNPPIRIRYSAAESNLNKEWTLYYKDGRLISADLKISYTSGKKRKLPPFTKQFNFPEGNLRWQSRSDDKNYLIEDTTYSFDYLFREETLIRKMIYK